MYRMLKRIDESPCTFTQMLAISECSRVTLSFAITKLKEELIIEKQKTFKLSSQNYVLTEKGKNILYHMTFLFEKEVV